MILALTIPLKLDPLTLNPQQWIKVLNPAIARMTEGSNIKFKLQGIRSCWTAVGAILNEEPITWPILAERSFKRIVMPLCRLERERLQTETRC